MKPSRSSFARQKNQVEDWEVAAPLAGWIYVNSSVSKARCLLQRPRRWTSSQSRTAKDDQNGKAMIKHGIWQRYKSMTKQCHTMSHPSIKLSEKLHRCQAPWQSNPFLGLKPASSEPGRDLIYKPGVDSQSVYHDLTVLSLGKLRPATQTVVWRSDVSHPLKLLEPLEGHTGTHEPNGTGLLPPVYQWYLPSRPTETSTVWYYMTNWIYNIL